MTANRGLTQLSSASLQKRIQWSIEARLAIRRKVWLTVMFMYGSRFLSHSPTRAERMPLYNSNHYTKSYPLGPQGIVRIGRAQHGTVSTEPSKMRCWECIRIGPDDDVMMTLSWATYCSKFLVADQIYPLFGMIYLYNILCSTHPK